MNANIFEHDLSVENTLKLARHFEMKRIEVYSSWNNVRQVRSFFKKSDVVFAKWNDYRDNWKNHELPDFWKESTYEDCVEMELEVETLLLVIKFFEGGYSWGRGFSLPRTWHIQVTQHDDKFFEQLITPRVIEQAANNSISELQKRERARREKEAAQIFMDILKEAGVEDHLTRSSSSRRQDET